MSAVSYAVAIPNGVACKAFRFLHSMSSRGGLLLLQPFYSLWAVVKVRVADINTGIEDCYSDPRTCGLAALGY